MVLEYEKKKKKTATNELITITVCIFAIKSVSRKYRCHLIF